MRGVIPLRRSAPGGWDGMPAELGRTLAWDPRLAPEFVPG